jgi:hypothetical protein
MKDVRLSKNAAGDYDLVFENGEFPFIEDGDQAAQNGLIRLLMFRPQNDHDGNFTGDSVTRNLDADGTRWYQVIFNATKSLAEKNLEIKRRILGTPGVIRILTFAYSLDDHVLNITGNILTEWGEVDITQEIEVL